MTQTPFYKRFAASLDKLLADERVYSATGEIAPAVMRGLTVALSGGVDSVVLLHLCRHYVQAHTHLALQAIYVDHGLSPNSAQWRAFCQAQCDALAVDFTPASVKVVAQSRQSLEAQARTARYQALDAQAYPHHALVLGQHADDQVETFLLRLKRGSGLKGLGAMHARTVLPSGRVCLRPLLTSQRADIEAFAHMFEISHIEDESNLSDRFDRNFLRNQVLPLLKSRFSGFVPSVMRSVELLQGQQALLDEITQTDLAYCSNDNSLCIERLGGFTLLRQQNLVRAWLAEQGVQMPSHKQLEQILGQALNARADAQMAVTLPQGQVRRFRGALYWVIEQPAWRASHDIGQTPVVLDDAHTLQVQQGKGVRVPAPDEQVSVRFNCLSEKVKPLGRSGRNTLKHWLKDYGVPTWERSRVPLIYYNDELVQVVGFFVNEAYASSQGLNWKLEDARNTKDR
ncbi:MULTISPECIES: tRNA lysidine(34) synthetase TilS [unclassified Pseudoalteromonas]|uniref:tRNA lysidine(34) synthetase TilS n=1 Tax=unclassified Pseudoalteromonas TaxID=194690 RepID=UPI002097D74C|nr:tRNA lysidine(34) synthetase TilS [Pseudoalteromonas sp. XMcav2-N]MCO7189938.1 tRNA lysidine(34) synthetase TilS [Pseudoalteromonas sp. XMcav2-N]